MMPDCIYFTPDGFYDKNFLIIFSDQIDENLRLTIQKDLTTMAPGLTVQV